MSILAYSTQTSHPCPSLAVLVGVAVVVIVVVVVHYISVAIFAYPLL